MNRIFTFEREEDLTFETPLPMKVERAVRLTTRKCTALTLRRLNSDETAYDPGGKYFETRVVLPNHKANALTELTGFRADEFTTEEFGGSIGYQLSNDDGVIWRTFDTGSMSWVPAVGLFLDVFVSQATVEARIGVFPLTPAKQLRIRVKLTPSVDGSKRPLLRNAVVYTEYDYDFVEDLARSLKHHLEKTVRVRTRWVENATAAPTIVVDSGLRVSGPVRVFNLSTDPDRTIDLFVAVNPDGKTVVLSSAQTGKVEVNYFGIPEVFLAAEENYQLGTIPAVIVTEPTITNRRGLDELDVEYDINRETLLARRRAHRTHFDANIVLLCQAQLEHLAGSLGDAVEKALWPSRAILSEATGELFSILNVGPKAQVNQSTRSLFVRNVPTTLGGKAWLRPEYVELHVAEKIITTVVPASEEQTGGAAGDGFVEVVPQ